MSPGHRGGRPSGQEGADPFHRETDRTEGSGESQTHKGSEELHAGLESGAGMFN